MSVFLTMTWALFSLVTNFFYTQSASQLEATERQVDRLNTVISIDSTTFSPCQYTATVRNQSQGISIADYTDVDVITRHKNLAGNYVATRHVSGDWTVSSIDPDNTNPNVWDPDETATLAFELDSDPVKGSLGTLAVAVPGGTTDSAYFDAYDCPLLWPFYWHNDPTPPTGDTASHSILQMNNSQPTYTGDLSNYDTDRDAFPGLVIEKGGSGVNETDPEQHQVWRAGPLTEPLVSKGSVFIDFWAGTENFQDKKKGTITVFLRDRNATGDYTEIGSGTISNINWQGGTTTFVKSTITVPDINYIVPEGHYLEAKLIVPPDSSGHMWFAYDTVTYPAVMLMDTALATYYPHSETVSFGPRNRRKITFDNSGSGEALLDFPVLVSLSSGDNIDYSKTQDQGQDIRFFDDDGTTQLSYEIERWDESGTSTVWVKVPQINTGSNTDFIWMYYNDPTTGDAQNATGVWDSNFTGVWHLKEKPTVDPNASDSTSNNNDGTFVGTMTSGDQISGKIGVSLDFDGADDYVDISNVVPEVNVTQGTLSAWINMQGGMESDGLGHGIFGVGSSANNDNSIALKKGSANGLNLKYRVSDTNSEAKIPGISTGGNTWYHIVGVWDSGNVYIYQDGSLVDSVPRGADINLSNLDQGTFGADSQAARNLFFNGYMDEVRISDTDRSADWIKAQYKSMNLDFSTYGAEESIGTYYQLKREIPGDGTAITISSVFSAGQTGRIAPGTAPTYGKFVYPLTGINKIPASVWNVTYRLKWDNSGSGFEWFTNAYDISLTTTGDWQDIDLSSYIPVGASGAIVEVVNSGDSTAYSGVLRGKEDTRDYMSDPNNESILESSHRWQIVKVDSNRVVQGYVEHTDMDFYLLGYTVGSDPTYFTTPPDVTPGTTGSWTAIDLSAHVDADADGAILLIDSVSASNLRYGIREVGSSFNTTNRELQAYEYTMYLVGIDGADQFDAYIQSSDVKLYLVGQTKGSVVYYLNDISVTDPSFGSWQQLDADDYLTSGDAAAANGLIFRVENNSGTTDRRLSVRHGDSTDDRDGNVGRKVHFAAGIGLTDGNVWDEYMESNQLGVSIAAYTKSVSMDAHADIDVIIRKADGTVRTTVATNVANSSNLNSTTWKSYTAEYTFPGYVVGDDTDYLEISFFAEATSNPMTQSVTVDLGIDDPSLPEVDQTRLREDVPVPVPPPPPPTLYVVDGPDDAVYTYGDDGTFLGSYSLDGGNAKARGITTGDSKVWSTNTEDDKTYQYDSGFSLVTTWAQGVLNGNGITTDGNNIYIVDNDADKVYKYTIGVTSRQVV